jgi:hypothetical protein
MNFDPDKAPSLDQINEILKLRERKALNQEIERLDSDDPRRLVLINAREQQIFDEKRQAFHAETEEKVRVLTETLQEREDMVTQLGQARVDKVRWANARESEQFAKKIERERMKSERALLRSRPALGPPIAGAVTKRDIIGEHLNFASKVYAPPAREGHIPGIFFLELISFMK